jgi:hypothetical protein
MMAADATRLMLNFMEHLLVTMPRSPARPS